MNLDPSPRTPGSLPEERGRSQPPSPAFPSPAFPPLPIPPFPTSVSNFLTAPWISGRISRSEELCLGFFPDYEHGEWLGRPLGVDARVGGRCEATNCHGIGAGRGRKRWDPAPNPCRCQVSFLLPGCSRFRFLGDPQDGDVRDWDPGGTVAPGGVLLLREFQEL